MHFNRLEANIDDERIASKEMLAKKKVVRVHFYGEVINGALLKKICRNAISPKKHEKGLINSSRVI
ncbi:TPA: hypothetical protein OO122_001615 [Legionella pneumophila]|nr:hypothetical protein [Legionella pneumophila]HAT2066126.1 hypothetical protein [Legionella pneumophila]HCR5122478.1 hypothetical protein [Legionella pneumophila]HCR5125292.1 hypothetical protein [Legionella pneumophila]HCR5129760.1 hypothetical protein [Legionella pneumophila]HCR5132805.1 hypothetical protein [Legionella pneumophila]